MHYALKYANGALVASKRVSAPKLLKAAVFRLILRDE